MFRYREPSEPTLSGGSGDGWVDFPASPVPDPWAALLRESNRLPPGVCGDEDSAQQKATRQVAPFARSRAHRGAEPEAVTAKNG
jgi:hypothetical protein